MTETTERTLADLKAGDQVVSAETDRLKKKVARLSVAMERLINVTDVLIHEHDDPGTEALAAVWSARRELQRP